MHGNARVHRGSRLHPLPVCTYIAYDPKTRAPICFDPQAARTVLPYYEFRNKLGLEGKAPEQVAEAVQAAYINGEITQRHEVSFAYMWSADKIFGPAGHWHPHMMVFAPCYVNSMLGGNEDSHHLPAVGDDSGTPFAVINPCGWNPRDQDEAIAPLARLKARGLFAFSILREGARYSIL